MSAFFMLAAILFTTYAGWLIHPALGFFVLGCWCFTLSVLRAIVKATDKKDKK